jgi:ABC-type amino acid transport substrate-binding protein
LTKALNVRALRAILLTSVLVQVGLSSTLPAAEPSPLRVTAACPVSPFDLELLSIFGKLRGRPVLTVDPPSRGPVTAVTDGSADLATGLVADGEDLGSLVLTSEVLPTRLVAVTRRPGARATSIEALRRTRLGILRGSRARSAIQAAKISGAELVEFGRTEHAVTALREGSLTAVLLELPAAFAARRADSELEFGTFLGPKASLVYAVAAHDRSVAEELDRFLASIRKTPSWGALLARSYGPEALEVLGRAWTTQ